MTLLVGCIIGLILGLTGAGGSVFAVPLLIGVVGLAALPGHWHIARRGCSGSAVRSPGALRSGEIQWLPAAVYATLGALTTPVRHLAQPPH